MRMFVESKIKIAMIKDKKKKKGILFTHNNLPWGTLPLCLNVKPKYLCSGPCPPVDSYRKEVINTSPTLTPQRLAIPGNQHF